MWEAKPKGLSFKILTASALKAVLKAAILLSLPLIGINAINARDDDALQV